LNRHDRDCAKVRHTLPVGSNIERGLQMINRLSKIFRFNLYDFLPNGKHLISDFQIIDEALNFDPNKIDDSQELADLIVKGLKQISAQIYLPITLYISTNEKNWGIL
jgi:hypothetical protein